MQVYAVFPENFSSNSYVLTCDDKTAVVIDPSEEAIEFIDRQGLSCRYVLLTHGHFDHVGGCGVLCRRGAKILCGEGEKDLIFSKEYLSIFGGVNVPDFKIAQTVKDGEILSLCGLEIRVYFTAGHTAGSVCYVCGSYLFSGDTLFKGSIGRTDLPTGNINELFESLKLLKSFKGDFKVYCGHGEATSLNTEIKYNPYMRNLDA